MTPPTRRPLHPHRFPTHAAVVVAVVVAVVAGIAVAGWVAAASWADGSATAEVSPWSGPLVVAAAVLALAGLAKVARPAPARQALAGIGLAVPVSAIRALGAAEVVVGTVAVVAGGRIAAAAVAAGYLGFAVVSWALGRAGAAGCGCFGRSVDATPGSLHLTLNVLAAVAAGGAALASSAGVLGLVADTPWAGVPAVLASATGAALLVAAYVAIPEAMASARPPAGPRPFALVEDFAP